MWSTPLLQAAEWVRQHPGSKRAINHQLNLNLIMGNAEQVDKDLLALQAIDNDDIYPSLKGISIANCYRDNGMSDTQWDEIINKATSLQYRGTSVLSEFRTLEYQYTHGQCSQLRVDKLTELIDALLNNTTYAPVSGELHEIASTFAILMGDLYSADDHIRKAIEISPDIDRKVMLLRIVVAREDRINAENILQDINLQLQVMPRQRLYYGDMLNQLEQQIAEMQDTPPPQAD